MTRDEVLDLLPLHAGGDLDDEQRRAVLAALEADPALAEEARAWSALDAALARGLAPEPEPAPAPQAAPAAPRVTVRRRCPYCHDALQATALALCATCATPHHAACFAQHHGCSLLGCGGTRSVAVDAPESVVCAGCERNTPAGAPYCAWCGAAVTGVARPRHEEAPVLRPEGAWSPRRYVAAAVLLVASTFGMGAFFGVQQRTMVKNVELMAISSDALVARAASDMPMLLEYLHSAQETYRDEDHDRDGRPDFAPDLETLAASEPGRLWGEFQRLNDRRWWTGFYDLRVHASADGARYCAVARPLVKGLQTWFVNHEGVVRYVHDPRDIDVEGCVARHLPRAVKEEPR